MCADWVLAHGHGRFESIERTYCCQLPVCRTCGHSAAERAIGALLLSVVRPETAVLKGWACTQNMFCTL